MESNQSSRRTRPSTNLPHETAPKERHGEQTTRRFLLIFRRRFALKSVLSPYCSELSESRQLRTQNFSLRTSVFKPPCRFPMAVTDQALTTNEGFLDLASLGATAQSSTPRISSEETKSIPAQRGTHLRPSPIVVHGRYTGHRIPAEDCARSIGADGAAHQARVHQRCASPGNA